MKRRHLVLYLNFLLTVRRVRAADTLEYFRGPYPIAEPSKWKKATITAPLLTIFAPTNGIQVFPGHRRGSKLKIINGVLCLVGVRSAWQARTPVV
jgi:hypothetical protein